MSLAKVGDAKPPANEPDSAFNGKETGNYVDDKESLQTDSSAFSSLQTAP